MRITFLTPGTGNFHCGCCLRDHALVKQIRALGHDADMVPLYLPFVLDESLESDEKRPILFGGINVFLQQKMPWLGSLPRMFGRILDAPGLLRMASHGADMTSARQLAQMTISTLQGEHGRQRGELKRLTQWLNEHGRPQVVCLSNGLLVGMARQIKSQLGARVVCTLHGEDAFLDALDPAYRDEAWAAFAERIQDVDAVVAISRYQRDLLQKRLGIPDDKLHLVYNGVEANEFQPAASPPSAPTIGYMARMCANKGLHTLIDAFVLLGQDKDMADVRLRIGGAMTHGDKAYVQQQRDKLTKHGLAERAEFLPNIELQEKVAFLQSLSVISVPATYGETFGLYVLEAWGSGIPLVQPRHGSFPELLEQTGGGILVDPDDPQALADGLRVYLSDPTRRQADGAKGRQAVMETFNARRMAGEFEKVCHEAAKSL